MKSPNRFLQRTYESNLYKNFKDKQKSPLVTNRTPIKQQQQQQLQQMTQLTESSNIEQQYTSTKQSVDFSIEQRKQQLRDLKEIKQQLKDEIQESSIQIKQLRNSHSHERSNSKQKNLDQISEWQQKIENQVNELYKMSVSSQEGSQFQNNNGINKKSQEQLSKQELKSILNKFQTSFIAKETNELKIYCSQLIDKFQSDFKQEIGKFQQEEKKQYQNKLKANQKKADQDIFKLIDQQVQNKIQDFMVEIKEDLKLIRSEQIGSQNKQQQIQDLGQLQYQQQSSVDQQYIQMQKNFENSIQLLQKQIEEMKNNNQKKLEQIENDIKNQTLNETNLKQQLSDLNQKVHDFSNNELTYKNIANKFETQIKEQNQSIQNLFDKSEQIYSELSQQHQQLTVKLSELSQSQKSEVVQEQQVDKTNKDLQISNQQLDQLQSNYAQLKQQVEQNSQSMINTDKSIKLQNDKLTLLENKIQSLNETQQKDSQTKNKNDDNQSLSLQIQNQTKKIIQLEQGFSSLNENYQQLESNYDDIQKVVTEIQKNTNKISEIEQSLVQFKGLEQTTQGLGESIQKINDLEQRITQIQMSKLNQQLDFEQKISEFEVKLQQINEVTEKQTKSLEQLSNEKIVEDQKQANESQENIENESNGIQ